METLNNRLDATRVAVTTVLPGEGKNSGDLDLDETELIYLFKKNITRSICALEPRQVSYYRWPVF